MTIHENMLNFLGKTPFISIPVKEIPYINLFAKLEFYNPTGSIKDRAADYIIRKCLENNTINKDTIIIESSSGNFGVSLAAYCKKNNLKFICVIDPKISPVNEMLMKTFGAQTIKVEEQDETGGYLLTRIATIKEFIANINNVYWVNQYSNSLNAEAYYKTLGQELCVDFNHNIDYIFVGVSSGGTITGISRRIKERYPKAKVIAVDIWGSVIFGNPPKTRYIPGIGSSMTPGILKEARIDEVVMVDEIETINCCRKLLQEHLIFAGGSSGSVFAAICKYFKTYNKKKSVNVLTLFPDRGERYYNTIYNDHWCNDLFTRRKENAPDLIPNIKSSVY